MSQEEFDAFIGEHDGSGELAGGEQDIGVIRDSEDKHDGQAEAASTVNTTKSRGYAGSGHDGHDTTSQATEQDERAAARHDAAEGLFDVSIMTNHHNTNQAIPTAGVYPTHPSQILTPPQAVLTYTREDTPVHITDYVDSLSRSESIGNECASLQSSACIPKLAQKLIDENHGFAMHSVDDNTAHPQSMIGSHSSSPSNKGHSLPPLGAAARPPSQYHATGNPTSSHGSVPSHAYAQQIARQPVGVHHASEKYLTVPQSPRPVRVTKSLDGIGSTLSSHDHHLRSVTRQADFSSLQSKTRKTRQALARASTTFQPAVKRRRSNFYNGAAIAMKGIGQVSTDLVLKSQREEVPLSPASGSGLGNQVNDTGSPIPRHSTILPFPRYEPFAPPSQHLQAPTSLLSQHYQPPTSLSSQHLQPPTFLPAPLPFDQTYSIITNMQSPVGSAGPLFESYLTNSGGSLLPASPASNFQRSRALPRPAVAPFHSDNTFAGNPPVSGTGYSMNSGDDQTIPFSSPPVIPSSPQPPPLVSRRQPYARENVEFGQTSQLHHAGPTRNHLDRVPSSPVARHRPVMLSSSSPFVAQARLNNGLTHWGRMQSSSGAKPGMDEDSEAWFTCPESGPQ